MKVNYKDNDLWQTMELNLGTTDCPVCGQVIEINKWKKEAKHPDYKCSNRECGCGFWIPKEKPRSVEKPKINQVIDNSNQFAKIIELLEKIETNTRL